MNRYLLVIDYQNDFVDGALGFPGAEKLDAKIAEKVRSYGKGRVLFTRDTHFARVQIAVYLSECVAPAVRQRAARAKASPLGKLAKIFDF